MKNEINKFVSTHILFQITLELLRETNIKSLGPSESNPKVRNNDFFVFFNDPINKRNKL